MEKWERAVNNVYPFAFVAAEYKKMLQMGKSNIQAEKLFFSYCTNLHLDDPIIKGKFHVALALAQWKLGRLSLDVKEKALSQIPLLEGALDKSVLSAIYERLLMQPPPIVSVSKPRVQHCPWREGSLLAYRIQNSEKFNKSCYWNKYVLLRVIKIVRWPFCKLVADECYSETMLVALYNWVGDELPRPAEIDNIPFTNIVVRPALLQRRHLNTEHMSRLIAANEPAANQLISIMTHQYVETCFSLSWDRASRQNGTFTLLDCNPDFLRNGFSFQTDTTNYSMGGPHAFDAVLCNRLEVLYGSHKGEGTTP